MFDVDTVQVNNGFMQLHITDIEAIGNGGRKYTVYNIKGNDSLGPIEVIRRYKEFFVFREVLFQRYPGMFIPPIPPKQATGNKEETFVQERMYFLDQFLRTLCRTYYLCKTPEVQVFLRPQGKVEDSLKSLSATTTDKVLQFYTQNLQISSLHPQEGVLARYTAEINDFVKE